MGKKKTLLEAELYCAKSLDTLGNGCRNYLKHANIHANAVHKAKTEFVQF